MIERNLECAILREMGIQKKPDELSAKTRKNLEQFCMKWVDVLNNLDAL